MNKEVQCKTHPDAPHGFVRNASHTEDRLVCECEYWEEPKVNERIRLLADQARKHYPGTELSGEYWVFDEQLFAQLIVQECAEIADKAEPYKASELIMKHFYIDTNWQKHKFPEL